MVLMPPPSARAIYREEFKRILRNEILCAQARAAGAHNNPPTPVKKSDLHGRSVLSKRYTKILTLKSFNSTGSIALKMTIMQLIEFSWRRQRLNVSEF
jgi:hypothetical protein